MGIMDNLPNQVAIDIVLSPPIEIAQAAIAMSNELYTKNGKEPLLNTVSCFPHISLLMGVANNENITQLQELIQKIAAPYLPLTLEVEGIDEAKHTTGIRLAKTSAIQNLSNELVAQVAPLLDYNPTTEMFFDKPAGPTIDWVTNFLTKATGENFNPHITVGAASSGEMYKGPSIFSCSTIALYQLGNFCTCRRLLS
jgi:2'-5' RNA ligase